MAVGLWQSWNVHIQEPWAGVNPIGLHVDELLLWCPGHAGWLLRFSYLSPELQAMCMWTQSYSICFSRSVQETPILGHCARVAKVLEETEKMNFASMFSPTQARTAIMHASNKISKKESCRPEMFAPLLGALKLVTGRCISFSLSNHPFLYIST